MQHDLVTSHSRMISAQPDEIFDLLANPALHGEIDGSGHVTGAQPNGPERLHLGANFGMDMAWGVKYKIVNTVVEFEEGRRIAWRHFGGHVWRYILEPRDGGTLVTEEFDSRTSRAPLLLRAMRAHRRNSRDIETTLERLEQWAQKHQRFESA
ncbi:SRPBCC family protein [Micrococcales bacterium 31B]|nr:SRPBCC family protein [Micrococcales bacterium 31B]